MSWGCSKRLQRRRRPGWSACRRKPQRVSLPTHLPDRRFVWAQATPPATPDPPQPVAAVSGFGIAPGTRNSPANNPGAGKGGPNAAQRPSTPPSALANSLRSSPSPPREDELEGASGATSGPGQAVSAEELAKQTARRVKVPSSSPAVAVLGVEAVGSCYFIFYDFVVGVVCM